MSRFVMNLRRESGIGQMQVSVAIVAGCVEVTAFDPTDRTAVLRLEVDEAMRLARAIEDDARELATSNGSDE